MIIILNERKFAFPLKKTSGYYMDQYRLLSVYDDPHRLIYCGHSLSTITCYDLYLKTLKVIIIPENKQNIVISSTNPELQCVARAENLLKKHYANWGEQNNVELHVVVPLEIFPLETKIETQNGFPYLYCVSNKSFHELNSPPICIMDEAIECPFNPFPPEEAQLTAVIYLKHVQTFFNVNLHLFWRKINKSLQDQELPAGAIGAQIIPFVLLLAIKQDRKNVINKILHSKQPFDIQTYFNLAESSTEHIENALKKLLETLCPDKAEAYYEKSLSLLSF
jgi:hypothetical protein